MTCLGVILLSLVLAAQTAFSQDIVTTGGRQCVSNPAGRVSFDVIGTPGEQGGKGERGTNGPKGQKGEDGREIQGPRGFQGGIGIRGGIGPPGPPGPTGTQGHKGNKGSLGQKGQVGQGDEGPRGPTGERGQIGSEGPRGSSGPPGLRGPTGDLGPKGMIGPQGPPGPPGILSVPANDLEKVRAALTTAFVSEFSAQVRDLRQEVQAIREELLVSNTTIAKLKANSFKKCAGPALIKIGIDTPATSCHEIFERDFSCIDGYYLIEIDGKEVLTFCKKPTRFCGVQGDWKQVGYLNMEKEGAACPGDLREEADTNLGLRACGRRKTKSCSSLVLPASSEPYRQVCGRFRGYQFGNTDAFWQHQVTDINGPYLQGASITHGKNRTHVWSLAAGASEVDFFNCPCAADPTHFAPPLPAYVGSHHFCESGFETVPELTVAWRDPLWDGSGCREGNQCCAKAGWFHRELNETTSDYIEVRLCGPTATDFADVLLDYFEIWIL